MSLSKTPAPATSTNAEDKRLQIWPKSGEINDSKFDFVFFMRNRKVIGLEISSIAIVMPSLVRLYLRCKKGTPEEIRNELKTCEERILELKDFPIRQERVPESEAVLLERKQNPLQIWGKTKQHETEVDGWQTFHWIYMKKKGNTVNFEAGSIPYILRQLTTMFLESSCRSIQEVNSIMSKCYEKVDDFEKEEEMLREALAAAGGTSPKEQAETIELDSE
jgi:hypothetical protein